MKNNNDTNSTETQTSARDPEPLYRQEKNDAWDAILHTLLELCLPAALVLCGMSMSGVINGSKPAHVAAAHVAVTKTIANPAQGFKVAAR